jgi:hypothetical protein
MTQVGATLEALAAAGVKPVREPFRVSASPLVAPTSPEPTDGQLRREVMARRGVDELSLYQLPSSGRIATEIEINTEVARRGLQLRPLRTTGRVLDIRV